MSALALLKSTLNRIGAIDELNAFITVTKESARERTQAADAAAARREHLGPLHDVPVAIKDLLSRKEGDRNTM